MKIFRTRKLFQKWRSALFSKIKVGFVPTMGALHEGHLSLVKRSLRENDVTVVSIFVNPTQFGPKEDYQTYPRQEKEDLAMLRNLGVDCVFIPQTAEEIYSKGSSIHIIPRASLTKMMEGKFRPGHFEGVTTVVLKLFNLVQPQKAYFGEKDYQQFQVIKAMVEDLFLPIKVIACPTVRERSGLAMSSRNFYFKVEDRKKAADLYQTLKNASSLEEAKGKLQKLGFKIQYLECWNGTQRRWLVAAHFKGVRLIDNIKCCF